MDRMETRIDTRIKTVKLYDLDAYATEFTAVVVSCEPRVKDGGTVYDAVLDRTLFFPEEGGQSCDRGELDGNPVIDVQIDGHRIVHTVAVPFAPGASVQGKINWPQRFSGMQQHSGEHILSGLVYSRFGFHNVGFHLGSQAVTLDFDGYLLPEELTLLEDLSNEAIYRNVEISACYPDPDVLATLDYRSKKAISGPVRIVTIPGYDVCACCAPHVRRTGEIGLLKIVDAIRYKGGIRISILCGSRALTDYRKKQEQVSAVSVLLSARPELISDAVSRQKEEIYSLKGKLVELTRSLVEQKAAAIKEGSGSLCLFEPDLPPDAHRRYATLAAIKCSGVCAVFAGNDTDGYRYILCGNGDPASFHEQLKSRLQAKGGGREMIQGSLHALREEITELFREVTGKKAAEKEAGKKEIAEKEVTKKEVTEKEVTEKKVTEEREESETC